MKRKDRTSMDKTRQVLKMKNAGYSINSISRSLKMCTKTVCKIIEKDNLSPPILAEPAAVIEVLKLGNARPPLDLNVELPAWLIGLDWEHLVKERLKGVPFNTLYAECGELPISYWAFWRGITRAISLSVQIEPKTTMRLNHKPGEKTFVDYADGIDIYETETGEVVKTQLFVGTLPFSSRVYAEFSFSQKTPSFIASHERMWKFLGGVTPYTVSDNLKSAVIKADLYDPDRNKTFCAYANHAGFALLPARPRRPKDKANVECHVGVLQRSFYPKVRNHTFTSIAELNEALWEHINELNDTVMKDHGVSRNERFEVEKLCLQPVPSEDFEIPEVKEATVHPDCHIQFSRSFYSVPYRYVGRKVRVVGTLKQLSIFDTQTLECIAVHSPSRKPGERKTNDLHWPEEKFAHCSFTLDRALSDALKIGPKTTQMITYLFSLPHPLQYLRRVQGWIRNVSHGKFSNESMEYASKQALQHSRYSSKYVNSCAEFSQKGGELRAAVGSAPKRDLRQIFVRN
jgi:hypothetical protein